MERERFEALVAQALNDLPTEFHSKLENIDVVIEDWPTSMQLTEMELRHRTELLGLYEGVPQNRRGGGYSMVLPDKITIFQRPIEAKCRSDGKIEMEIQAVLRHEIAHHFGMSEEDLRRIESEKRRKARYRVSPEAKL